MENNGRSDNGSNFKRVLEITEKSVEAWSKAFGLLEDLEKKLEWLNQEYKDLNNMLRQKPCITETVPYAALETFVRQQCEARTSEHGALKEAINGVKADVKTSELKDDKLSNLIKIAVVVIAAVNGIIGLLAILLYN